MLSAFGVFSVDGDLIEFLIAATIFITGISSLTKAGQNPKSKLKPWLAGIFGLIHGFGFSRYYGMIAEATNPWVSLPSFTLGIELGQLIIVVSILILAWLLENAFSINKRDWNLIISGGVLGIATIMMLERLPHIF
jgi:hydrogenase/urease accessory protein HupE